MACTGDHTVTALTPITGYNPGGMIVAPWGELLVANEGTVSSELHGIRFRASRSTLKAT
jgi:hypothetical protein